jgi:ABC-type phosphate transport system permease subunit
LCDSRASLIGLLIAIYGVKISYFIDFITFAVSIVLLKQVVTHKHVALEKTVSTISSIKDGFKYATSRPELVGTYVVDILAMIFAMPMALYPAMAASWGGAKAAGWLYSAIRLEVCLFPYSVDGLITSRAKEKPLLSRRQFGALQLSH